MLILIYASVRVSPRRRAERGVQSTRRRRSAHRPSTDPSQDVVIRPYSARAPWTQRNLAPSVTRCRFWEVVEFCSTHRRSASLQRVCERNWLFLHSSLVTNRRSIAASGQPGWRHNTPRRVRHSVGNLAGNDPSDRHSGASPRAS